MDEKKYLEELTDRYPVLEPVKDSVWQVYEILRECSESAALPPLPATRSL